MKIKKYEFDYNHFEALATFHVDIEVFTAQKANDTLTFFSWSYDKEADPVDEVLKKYALQAIEHATFNRHNELGVIDDFAETEGYYPVDGSMGIKLVNVTGYEFDDNYLFMSVVEMEVENETI